MRTKNEKHKPQRLFAEDEASVFKLKFETFYLRILQHLR